MWQRGKVSNTPADDPYLTPFLPRASPYRSRTIMCLPYHPPSLSGKSGKIVTQYSRYVVFQTRNDQAYLPEGDTHKRQEQE
jgi:hypothetical protein